MLRLITKSRHSIWIKHKHVMVVPRDGTIPAPSIPIPIPIPLTEQEFSEFIRAGVGL